MKVKIKNGKFVSQDTGGATVTMSVEYETYAIGGVWMRTYQDKADALAYANLTRTTYRVLQFLDIKSGKHNAPPSSKKICDGLRINRHQLSRSFAELRKIGAVIKYDERYMLNPMWYFRGSEIDRNALIQEIFGKSLKEMGNV